MEAEAGVVRGHKPGNAGVFQKLEKARNQILPRSLQKEHGLPAPSPLAH